MLTRQISKFQSGATMAEFITVIPAILFLGIGCVQAGLIYHGKSTLNYATFEAARAGAVDHAQLDSMKTELGFRLAPLVGGDGSAAKAAEAIAQSTASVNLPLQTKIEILNPTIQAFDDWGQVSLETGARAIPNSHLRLRHDERAKIGTLSGLNLHDANLLKIKVTHGFKMRIPFIGGAIAKSLMLIDPKNTQYYAINQIPITSVATVRMQNEAWETQIIASAAIAPVGNTDTNTGSLVDDTQTGETMTPAVTPCTDEYGLTTHAALMSSADYAAGQSIGNGICGYKAPAKGDSFGVLGSGLVQSDSKPQLDGADTDGCD